MAKQTINGPLDYRHDFNASDSTEYGDTAFAITAKLNAMFTEIYSGAGFGSTTNPTFGNVTLTGLLTESFTDNITAFAGGGQAGATAIASEIARVTTVATAGDSVKLPAAAPGLTIMVIHHGAKPMQVCGAGTDQIDDQAAATGVSQMVNSVCIYVCTTTGKWYANGLGTGFAGSFETQSYADGLTAHAGGLQPSATRASGAISPSWFGNSMSANKYCMLTPASSVESVKSTSSEVVTLSLITMVAGT